MSDALHRYEACLLLAHPASNHTYTWNCSTPRCLQEAREKERAETDRLREAASLNAADFQAQLQLALTLHSLDHQSPDGGQRVPEAVQAYRCCLGHC